MSIRGWEGRILRLAPEDVVFEVGGYEGKWAKYIAETYNPHLYVFEPAPRAYKVAKEKLGGYPKVKVYNFGLGCRDAVLSFGDALRDGAGFYKKIEPIIKAEIVDAERFIEEQEIETIAVMRVNMEGGEFELIPYLICTGIVKRVMCLFIQWHYLTDIPSAGPMRVSTDALLRRTHKQIKPSLHRCWNMWERLDE